ncbi:hypothetical protein [Streptacidiphilus rugosus]|uniref:hypothetical protein n=1 Tax=Streptacidiphilus rugosus TaxID=405783 RepID=UPI00055C2390|nr:hypothetical protein [Streptacidiphilus rugosus]
MAPRHPNARLRALAHEAGWSGAALARAVNRTGAETGLALRYDRTSVAHWMAGTRPPGQVAALVAEALSRALGRPVTLADAGLEPAPAVAPLPADSPGRALAALDTEPARARPYRLALADPDHLGTGRPSRHGRTSHDGGVPVTRAHVRSAQAMLHTFTSVDAAFGGGHSRTALTGFLGNSVADWLNAPAPPRTRHELLLCASRLTCLAGLMCYDDEQQGTAQGYYLTAVGLAVEADDAPGHATALRALSAQAHDLGHREQALRLAEAAAAHALRLPATHAAAVLGQLAVAAAGQGDHRRALSVLDHSAELLGRPDEDGPGAESPDYHAAAHEHQHAEVRVALGDSAGAVAALRRSLRVHPPGERRARAVVTARLAELLLDGGSLEQACTAWHGFLDDYPLLRSGRADRALRALRSRLQPFRGSAAARGVLARTDSLRRPPAPALC